MEDAARFHTEANAARAWIEALGKGSTPPIAAGERKVTEVSIDETNQQHFHTHSFPGPRRASHQPRLRLHHQLRPQRQMQLFEMGCCLLFHLQLQRFIHLQEPFQGP